MIKSSSASLAVHIISNMTGSFRGALSALLEHGLMPPNKYAKTVHQAHVFPVSTHQPARMLNALVVSLDTSSIPP